MKSVLTNADVEKKRKAKEENRRKVKEQRKNRVKEAKNVGSAGTTMEKEAFVKNRDNKAEDEANKEQLDEQTLL